MENTPHYTQTQETTGHDEPEQLAFPVLPEGESGVAAKPSRWEQVLREAAKYENSTEPTEVQASPMKKFEPSSSIENLAEVLGRRGGLPLLEQAIENYKKSGKPTLADELTATRAYRSFLKDRSPS